ncbi:MAG: MarR family transcriptional regulator [Oscillospiraceae bacterium]|jgi:DNA-binding MarR family transcriptional regulator|nr:MarR family transcriptional regulator [Oscillospiraceae bacterium]
MRRETCGNLIKQIHDAVGKRVNNLLREDGLTFTQIRVLMELGEHGGEAVSLKELERLFHVAQPTIVGTVRRLEAKGLVEGFISPEDNRVKLVKLTESGGQFREANMRAIDEMENRLTSALTESERLEFLRMLRTVHESIK